MFGLDGKLMTLEAVAFMLAEQNRARRRESLTRVWRFTEGRNVVRCRAVSPYLTT